MSLPLSSVSLYRQEQLISIPATLRGECYCYYTLVVVRYRPEDWFIVKVWHQWRRQDLLPREANWKLS